MAESPRFFAVTEIEGVTEIVLGTADFVSRPIIVLAQEEITHFIDQNKPTRLIINFSNVSHISSEFITAMIRIQDHVKGHDGQMKLSHLNETVYTPFKLTKLAGRLFMIHETTPEAIDAF
jgi:anti-anti-sigma factor